MKSFVSSLATSAWTTAKETVKTVGTAIGGKVFLDLTGATPCFNATTHKLALIGGYLFVDSLNYWQHVEFPKNQTFAEFWANPFNLTTPVSSADAPASPPLSQTFQGNCPWMLPLGATITLGNIFYKLFEKWGPAIDSDALKELPRSCALMIAAAIYYQVANSAGIETRADEYIPLIGIGVAANLALYALGKCMGGSKTKEKQHTA